MSEHTTEDTINRLRSLTEKLCLVQDRITIDHAVIEIQTAIAEAVNLRAERDEARREILESLHPDLRKSYADARGWDCLKEATDER